MCAGGMALPLVLLGLGYTLSGLKALGWVPRYPGFPAGFGAVLEADGISQSAR